MRRLIAFGGAVLAIACASMQSPPGGPQRKDPPALLAVTPDSGAVNVTDKNVVFSFDVIVDDHAGRNGKLENSFIVSPNQGGTVVTWKRSRVEVRPKGGFRPGIAYSVTMLPGVSDLNHNAMKETQVITFSTGATIPAFAIHGRVFDWMAERVSFDARIDAVRLPDSLSYIGFTDSIGQFRIGPLDTGTYAVRALVDGNKNGLLDANEIWDSTRVVVRAESPFVELRAAQRDTMAPRVLTVNPTDSVTLAVSFDRPLDPTATLTPDLFRVQRADSTTIAIRRVYTQEQFRRLRVSRDSTIAAARRDSIAKADTTLKPVTPPRGAPISEPAEPAAPVAPKPSAPAPARDVVLELDSLAPLQPMSAYRLTATVRGLTGLSKPSDRVVQVPRRDTTKAAPKP